MKRNETYTTYEFKRSEHDPKVKIKIWSNFVVLNSNMFIRTTDGRKSVISVAFMHIIFWNAIFMNYA